MKRALVTGGSGDIGGAICHRLAADGLHVIVHANSRPERAQAVVEAIRQDGGSAEAASANPFRDRLQPGPVAKFSRGNHRVGPVTGLSRFV